MTTKKGQKAWLRRMFGQLTRREEQAAIRYHEDMLHRQGNLIHGIEGVVRQMGKMEAEAVLGETRVRRMTKEHDDYHSLE